MSVPRAGPAAPAPATADGRLTVDRLASTHDPVEIALFDSLELSVLLLWIGRWYDGEHTEREDGGVRALALAPWIARPAGPTLFS